MSKINSTMLEALFEIEAVLLRYATALDERDWPSLSHVFAPEAIADYQGIGVFNGRPDVVGVVADFLGKCGPTQHMISNVRIEIEGERARSCCYLQAIHAGMGRYAGQTMTVWGEYCDQLELRPEGWLIVRRTLVVKHVAGDVGVALSAPAP